MTLPARGAVTVNGAAAAARDGIAVRDESEFSITATEDAELVIGSGRFIPGFEEQLKGAKVGEEKTIEVTFPEDYQAKHLAGKAATFDVTVKAIKAEAEAKINDEFATRLGLESLDQYCQLKTTWQRVRW